MRVRAQREEISFLFAAQSGKKGVRANAVCDMGPRARVLSAGQARCSHAEAYPIGPLGS